MKLKIGDKLRWNTGTIATVMKFKGNDVYYTNELGSSKWCPTNSIIRWIKKGTIKHFKVNRKINPNFSNYTIQEQSIINNLHN